MLGFLREYLPFWGVAAFMPLLRFLLLLLVTYLAVRIAERMIIYAFRRNIRRHEGPDAQVPSLLTAVVRAGLWVIGFLFLLSNLGVNITSLVAGLGIGGIAVALAAQNILGDLFSSFSIYFDKPFKRGDFVIIGQQMGTVKNIGLKTTRIEALSGEMIVVPNSQITSSLIQNYRYLRVRRVVFGLNVDPRTPSARLGAVPGWVREIVEAQEKARFDRCHVTDFTDAGARIEAVYYLDTDDYVFYMDTQQRVLLALKDRLEREKVAFSYPIRKVLSEGGQTDVPAATMGA